MIVFGGFSALPLLYSVTKQRPALNIRPGVFYTGIEGFAIRVEDKESDGTMNNILIHDHRNPERGASRVIKAESGKMTNDTARVELIIELHNGAQLARLLQIPCFRNETWS